MAQCVDCIACVIFVRFVFIQKINPLPHDMGIRIKSAIKSYIYMWHENLNNEKLK